MNGAESLVRTLVAGGVDVCFANPGTSEMHFVAALDAVPEMRGVLALFEGVFGASDEVLFISDCLRMPSSSMLTHRKLISFCERNSRPAWQHWASTTLMWRSCEEGIGA